MAQQTTVRFVDDLDGSEAVGTVTFALENRAYEIDLSDENTDKLHEALAPFIEHGSQGRRTFGWARPHPGAGGDDRHPRSLQPRGDPRDPRMGSRARSPGERPRAHLEVGHGGVQARADAAVILWATCCECPLHHLVLRANAATASP